MPLSLPAEIYRIRRTEYEAMARAGIFSGEKVELLDGVIVRKMTIRPPHSYVVEKLRSRLPQLLSDRAAVRSQQPLALSDFSEPEPDIAVVPCGDYLEEHPRDSLLLVEVADSTLERDGNEKGPRYSEAEVQDYWIVNLVDEVVEVYRRPRGTVFLDVHAYERGESIALLAFPDVTLAVDEILPPSR